MPNTLVTNRNQVLTNAFTLADAIRDRTIDAKEARSLVGNGRVFLPFRYGQGLAFAPAKFIGYTDNDIAGYRSTAKGRHGTAARTAISRFLEDQATPDASLDARLVDYCLQIGIELRDYKHSFWRPIGGTDERDRSAIDDIDAHGIGNDDPEYRRRIAGSYTRDQRVRAAVLARARGRCEYCGSEGFEMSGGRRYLEAHHVISLSEAGPDKPTNVIALCATDHRRAHFGADWEALQERFVTIIAKAIDRDAAHRG